MADTHKLLLQISRAVKAVNAATDRPELKALLGPAEFALNELMLQQSTDFYLNHMSAGQTLLSEGLELAHGLAVTSRGAARELSVEMRTEVILEAITDLQQQLLPVVGALFEQPSGETQRYVARVCEWQVALYKHSLEKAPLAVNSDDDHIDPERLLTYLEHRFPRWNDLALTRFVPLAGGFSKNTILFETQDSLNGTQSFVIRAEQPVNLLCLEGSNVAREFPMIQLMRAAGLPVAEPLWLETDRSQFRMPFIVSRKAAGKIYGSTIGSAETLSPAAIEHLIATLVQMHNIKIDPAEPLARQSHLAEWLGFKTVTDCTRHMVTTVFHRVLQRCDVAMTPDLLRVQKWLERNVPQSDEAPAIIHFDFALNNLLIEDDRLVAVLDWESSRLGDPAEDLTWTQQNLASYISMPELLSRYEAGTGRRVDEFRLAYARVLRCAMNTVCCLSASRALDTQERAHVSLTILAYQYLALFCAQSNELIEAAERVRR